MKSVNKSGVKFMKFSCLFKIALPAAMLFIAGCMTFEPNNNHLHPADFVRRLNDAGIHVDAVRPLDPKPIGARDAVELIIGESSIGVYKYDKKFSDQVKRLEKIKKSKRVYFVGIPYPIYETSGSFIIVGLDKHKEKQRILEVFRDFR